MSNYQGYSFNLHKEDDKDIIKWLNDKKITQTIKEAFRNQMKAENGEGSSDNDILKVLQNLPQLLQLLPQLNQVQGLNVEQEQVVEDEKKALTQEEQDAADALFEF